MTPSGCSPDSRQLRRERPRLGLRGGRRPLGTVQRHPQLPALGPQHPRHGRRGALHAGLTGSARLRRRRQTRPLQTRPLPGAVNSTRYVPGPAEGDRTWHAADPSCHQGRRQELGQSFQDGGEHYDRVRPGLSRGIGRLADPRRGAADAADLGAGTGKFTALLVGRGLRTVAVDPSADMLEQLRRALPGRHRRRGYRRAHGAARRCFRPGHRRPGLALVRSAAGQHGDRPDPPPARCPGADLEPAGHLCSLGAPALAHHACRRRPQTALHTAAGT